MLEDYTAGVPVLQAWRVNETQVAVWCDHCQKYHLHGAAALGHRLAHCRMHSGSPYLATGYYLRGGQTAPLPMQRALCRAGMLNTVSPRRTKARAGAGGSSRRSGPGTMSGPAA